MTTLRERVIAALQNGPLTRPQIADAMGVVTDSLGSVLTKMQRAGELSKESRRNSPYTLVSQERASKAPAKKRVARKAATTPAVSPWDDAKRIAATQGLDNLATWIVGEYSKIGMTVEFRVQPRKAA